MKTKYHRGIVLYKNGEDNKYFMKYYILRLNPMKKKRLGAKPHHWENILFWSVKF